MAEEAEIVVAQQELHDFVVRCMTAVGADPAHSAVLAELLVTADHRGHYSHGLNRLGKVFSFVKMQLRIVHDHLCNYFLLTLTFLIVFLYVYLHDDRL